MLTFVFCKDTILDIHILNAKLKCPHYIYRQDTIKIPNNNIC